MLAQANEYGVESVKQNNGLFVPKFMQWLNEEFRQKVKSPQYYTATRNINNYIKPFFQKKKQTDLTRDEFKKFFVFLEKQNVGMETRRKIKGILYQYFENEYANSPMRNPLDKIPIATKGRRNNHQSRRILFGRRLQGDTRRIQTGIFGRA